MTASWALSRRLISPRGSCVMWSVRYLRGGLARTGVGGRGNLLGVCLSKGNKLCKAKYTGVAKGSAVVCQVPARQGWGRVNRGVSGEGGRGTKGRRAPGVNRRANCARRSLAT
jgi:hypothetical protein